MARVVHTSQDDDVRRCESDEADLNDRRTTTMEASATISFVLVHVAIVVPFDRAAVMIAAVVVAVM